MNRQRFIIAAMAALASLPQASLAQSRPDAGVLQNQIERERQNALPPKAQPDIIIAPPAMTAPPSGLSVVVSAFQFNGNSELPSAQLSQIVAGFLGRPLDWAQLQRAAAAIAELYRTQGFIAHVYLPEQDVNNGVVTLQIKEAVFGGVIIDGAEPFPGYAEAVRHIVGEQLKIGEKFSIAQLDRALLLAGDIPGGTASGALQEGQATGETMLIIKTGGKPVIDGNIAVDNTDSRGTGPGRIVPSVNLNSPFGFGEHITVDAAHTQNTNKLDSDGSDYGHIVLTMPVGSDGLRLGVNGSYMAYSLIEPAFVSLGGTGTSATAGFDLTYPLIRARLGNLYLNYNLAYKAFDNRTFAGTTSRYSDRVATIGLTGNNFDKMAGGGANSAGLSLVGGDIDLNGSPNFAADDATARTSGTYAKLLFNAGRQQTIAEDLTASIALSGQIANKNLDSGEKFYLGGSSGVRAYPSSEGGGSDGAMLNLELRQTVAESVTLVGFFDYGRIIGNLANDFKGASPINAYSLKGAGLSASWQSAGGFTLKAVWSHRLGENPNPTPAGADQDGTLDKNRLWLSGGVSF